MTLDEARALLRQLLGSYPSAGATDPEVYVASLISLLTGYPLWAGQRAIEKTLDTSKFLPTRAEIKPLLEDQVRVHRDAAMWEAAAQRQAIAAQRAPVARIAGPPPAPRPTYDELRAKHGPNWGIRDPDGRPPPPTRDEAYRNLVDQFGQDAVDACPDAEIKKGDRGAQSLGALVGKIMSGEKEAAE